MMNGYPFLKLFTGDFLAECAGLSATERGVFITLLCKISETDSPIPRDDARVARTCGIPKPAFSKTLNALLRNGTMTHCDDELSAPLAEKQLADRRTRTRKATDAATKRWNGEAQKEKEEQRSRDAGTVTCH